jgi:hypothetical protein
MPAAITRNAIIIPPVPPIRKPTPMNSAVISARSMAVRMRFMRYVLSGDLPTFASLGTGVLISSLVRLDMGSCKMFFNKLPDRVTRP